MVADMLDKKDTYVRYAMYVLPYVPDELMLIGATRIK